jgi:hypothetical protein
MAASWASLESNPNPSPQATMTCTSQRYVRKYPKRRAESGVRVL